jgi:hypothetical protein
MQIVPISCKLNYFMYEDWNGSVKLCLIMTCYSLFMIHYCMEYMIHISTLVLSSYEHIVLTGFKAFCVKHI